MLFRLAFKNLMGAGIRTWLNVITLSFSFVAIVFLQGIYKGMSDQMETASIDAEYGGGQYWQKNYDPQDALSLEDAHSPVPQELAELINQDKAMPILIRSATIYPNGRLQNILMKGIPQNQSIVTIPSTLLQNDEEAIPALIGSRMAKNTGLSVGDYVIIRWRDVNGTFDASELKIVEIMRTDVASIDNGQVWIPLNKMRKMLLMPDEASIVVLEQGSTFSKEVPDWKHKDLTFLMQDIRSLYLTKSIGGSVFYIILLLLAMLAIFDTQILSIFRRRKEMGTMMAMGMTRNSIIKLFTIEGGMHALLAAIVAGIYGLPIFLLVAAKGYGLPESTDNFGLAIGNRIYPVFTAGLILGTTLLVLFVTTFVSYLPTRKIAKLKPTDALRGKMT